MSFQDVLWWRELQNGGSEQSFELVCYDISRSTSDVGYEAEGGEALLVEEVQAGEAWRGERTV